jgi:hypothetical protein
MYDAERQREINRLAEQQVEEEKRLVLVEEAKRKLLRENAAEYADYLPKGEGRCYLT